MSIPDLAEKWTGTVSTVTLGATAGGGGTRTSTVKLGGAKALPFLACDGEVGNRPAIAVEIWDIPPTDWPQPLTEAYGGVFADAGKWAKKAVEYGAEAVCLRLAGAHPDFGNRSAQQCAQTVKDVLAAVGVPLIIWGPGVDEKDNEIMPAVSAAARGENCLLGTAREKNNRTLVAVCLADKHKLIAESPLDINIAKQVNILCSDAGYALEDIVIFPTTGALGYGLEYVYSIQERGLLAGLGGDKLLAQPIICDVGLEAWRAKETKADPEIAGRCVKLAVENGAGMIGLTIDANGVPGNVNGRVELGAQIITIAMEGGLDMGKLFIDPIILPVNVAPTIPNQCIQSMSQLRMFADPPPHLVIGLSNLSQKCNHRQLINRTYLAMAIAHGLDAAILDPLDRELMEVVATAELLMGKSIYCDAFLEAALSRQTVQ